MFKSVLDEPSNIYWASKMLSNSDIVKFCNNLFIDLYVSNKFICYFNSNLIWIGSHSRLLFGFDLIWDWKLTELAITSTLFRKFISIDCCLLFQLFFIPDSKDGILEKGTNEEILNIPITSASGISVHNIIYFRQCLTYTY